MILILITAVYNYTMFVVTNSHKGTITQLEYKLYFKSQETTRFITLRPVVVHALAPLRCHSLHEKSRDTTETHPENGNSYS